MSDNIPYWARGKYEVNENGCWVWTRSKIRGYGSVRINRKTKCAHREMYQHINNVTLTTQQFVCHGCDNPLCINPSHLWVGTHSDNMRDCSKKGRSGNRRLPRRRMKNEEVAVVVALAMKIGVRPASRETGVHASTIGNWIYGRRRADVTTSL